MHAEYEELNPEFLRRHLKLMNDVELSEQTEAKFNLFAGLIATIKMLQPEGYHQTIPATVFHTVKE